MAGASDLGGHGTPGEPSVRGWRVYHRRLAPREALVYRWQIVIEHATVPGRAHMPWPQSVNAGRSNERLRARAELHAFKTEAKGAASSAR